MVKSYTYEEFRWKFLAREVNRFDLKKPHDVGRYIACQSLRKNMNGEEKRRLDSREIKEVKEGKMVKILCIENSKILDNYSSSYSLKKTA